MIRFALHCVQGHEFEAWFRNGDAYDVQKAKKEICCPECGVNDVEKALMAPAIGKSSKSDGPSMSPEHVRAALVELRRQVEQNCDNVGPQFAEEARKIHYGESNPRGIYGEATEEESRGLAEEGISFSRLPWPQPKN